MIPPLFSEAMAELLGPSRRRGAEITQRDMDIAASCQLHFEDTVLKCLGWLHSAMPTDTLVMAGNCALNGVCNAQILRETPFKKIVYSFRCGRRWNSLWGSALGLERQLNQLRGPAVQHAAWGPEYTENQLTSALELMASSSVAMTGTSSSTLLRRTWRQAD